MASAKARTADKVHVYKTVPLASVKPTPGNPRTHSDKQVAQLVRSIQEFGFTTPILIDEEGFIVAGHGRHQAAEFLELKEIPAIVLHGLTPAQRKALMVADNQLPMGADWDTAALARILGELDTGDFDLTLTGFAEDEIEDILTWAPGGVREGHTDPDAVPETPKQPVTKTGDLWIMGKHRLLCGDSFDPKDRERLLAGQLAGMVLTDPPYAIYGSSTGIAADIADDKMVRPFFEKLGWAIVESIPEFAHAYVHCDWRSYATLWHGLKSARLTPKNLIVWDKGSAGLGNSYANTHEFVAFFARLPKQKAMTSGDKRGQRPVHKPNLFRANRVTGDARKHNAAKPVELLGFLIENSSEVGDSVLDLFAGSGSTLIAAFQRDRPSFNMEMEPRFCDVAVQRWQEFTHKPATLGSPTGDAFEDVAKSRGKA